jgi:GTP pyrophosphokinase
LGSPHHVGMSEQTSLSPAYQRALDLVRAAGPLQEPLPSTEDVVAILLELGVDEETRVATLLSDRRLMDKLSLEAIEKDYGEKVVALVKSVRWLNNFRPCLQEEIHAPDKAERLRRLLLSMVDDVRAVIIKLAFRVARLQKLGQEKYEIRRCIARETLDIFAPIANRLGVAQLKWELEDLAFRYLDPQTYKKIAKSLEERRDERESYLQDFIQQLRKVLDEAGVKAQVYGRPKHIYSIWNKMQRKALPFDEMYDLRALRVIVPDITACYTVLGVINTHWKSIQKEFDDYIAHPKPNGYQSLHTVIIGPENKNIEIQIRTPAMHEFAELGFAAHWRYKEGSAQDHALQNAILSLRSLLEDGEEDSGLMENFQAEIFPDRVFVFTPKGDVIELPKGATPLDFAYAIHTDVGHRCRGAKVNGQIVPLTYQLKSTDQVEVLTAKQPRPSRDWMNPQSGFLASARARGKVRHWFHEQDRGDNLDAGKRIFEQTQKRWNAETRPMQDVLQHFHQQDEEALMIAIGRGDIRQSQLDAFLRPELERLPPKKITPVETGKKSTEAAIAGVGDLLTQVARCCKPVPGDEVVGYITQGKGITVHRQDCSNILNLPEERRQRLVKIDWNTKSDLYAVDLVLDAFDRTGLLNDVTQVLVANKINLIRADTSTDTKTQQVRMRLTVQIRDVDELAILLNRLTQINNVMDVRRA